jgi:hypothetical protein
MSSSLNDAPASWKLVMPFFCRHFPISQAQHLAIVRCSAPWRTGADLNKARCILAQESDRFAFRIFQDLAAVRIRRVPRDSRQFHRLRVDV